MIGASSVIILSYFANLIAKKTNIPSVLLLILLGIIIKEGMLAVGFNNIPFESLILELLGTVGLIFIVLEAALDLELSKEKWPIIWKSFVVALLALVGSSLIISEILHYFLIPDRFAALVYAIPLSIMSSAIIIPSVSELEENQKEFMIYESTFSDILGIMFFYLLLGNAETNGTGEIARSLLSNISFTLILSIVSSYALIFLLQRIKGHLKLFLTIAVLLLIYSVAKLNHLSPLILILVFGLMISNYKVFWRGKMMNVINEERLKSVGHEFHILTLETAFVIRTFFFVIFGITIVLSSLLDLSVVFYSLVIVVVLYLVRLLFLFIFQRKNIFPLLYIAPRGLITILLYFQIQSSYTEYIQEDFNQAILLFIIIATSIVMTISLIQHGLSSKISGTDFEEIVDEVEETDGQDACPEKNIDSKDIENES